MRVAITSTRAVWAICFLLVNSWVYAGCILTGCLYYLTNWYGPSLELADQLPDVELEECELSTDSWEDFTFDKNITKEGAKEVGEDHGVAMVRWVLTPETAEAFRDYVLKANQELPEIALRFDGTQSHRYHITPPRTEPAVQTLLREIAEHPALRLLIDATLGPSSSLINFSVLTSEYGAPMQPWHTDTGLSSSDYYPDYFVSEFTLVVAMQDTTKDMGAIGFCPGVGNCEGFEDVDCPMQAVMKQGDVFLYSPDMYHRDTAHRDPNGPARVFAFLTFAESRRGPNDKRKLAGADHLLDWRMFGHTIEDLATMQERPWRLWHSFGLFNGKGGSIRPWNLIDYVLNLYVNRENEAPSVLEGLYADDLDENVHALVWYYGIFVAAYLLIVVPLVVLFFASSGECLDVTRNRIKTTKIL